MDVEVGDSVIREESVDCGFELIPGDHLGVAQHRFGVVRTHREQAVPQHFRHLTARRLRG
jgi:hypothetical protein